MYNRSGEPRDYTRVIEALPDKLDIKRHSPGILYEQVKMLPLPNKIEPRHEKTNVLISTWSDTNRAVQPQKMARGLKFRIDVVEEVYYPCSENKGADQLIYVFVFALCYSFVFA